VDVVDEMVVVVVDAVVVVIDVVAGFVKLTLAFANHSDEYTPMNVCDRLRYIVLPFSTNIAVPTGNHVVGASVLPDGHNDIEFTIMLL
jgi:hypothetical protein